MRTMPRASVLVTVLTASMVLATATPLAPPGRPGVVPASLTSTENLGRDASHGPDTGYVTNVTTVTNMANVSDVTVEDNVPTAEAHRVEHLVRPWCGPVPLTVHGGRGGEAGFTASRRPFDWLRAGAANGTAAGTANGTVTEYLRIGLALPAGHPATRAVVLHECAHILQYRAYDHDWAALEEAMHRLAPDRARSPVEHMADCMSEVMGAERRGFTEDGEWYEAGYGGPCSREQADAAGRIVAGERP